MSVADLTGTTWEFNDVITITAGDSATYSISGEGHFLNPEGASFDGDFASIRLSRSIEPRASVLDCNDTVVYFAGWSGSPPFTISITGGTDVTNATLIAWLEANATQVIAGNTYEINHSLSHVTAGQFTIHIEPDTGYTYPESVTVTNGTLVSYDSTTGTAVVEGDDTTVIEAECVAAAPSGFALRTASNYDKSMCWGDLSVTTNNGNTYYLSEISAGQMIEDNVTSFSLAVSASWASMYIYYTMGGNSGSASFDPNNPSTVELTDDMYITYADCSCLTGDTAVTMADGTQKRLDEITLGDEVLSFDWKTMALIPRKVIFTDKDANKSFTEYDRWTFEDGTEVKTVHRHEFYNDEKGGMAYMDEWNIGDHAYKIDGTKVALVSHETVKEEVNHYKITLEGDTNYFANGLLNGDRNCPKVKVGG